MIKKIAKLFAWFVGSAISLAVLCYLVLLVINWRDATPSQEAVHFAQIHASRPSVEDEQNAFVYLLGISVSPELDPAKAGQAMLARMRSEKTGNSDVAYSHPDYPEIDLSQGRIHSQVAFREKCRNTDEQCLTLLETFKGDLSSRDQLLLERYRTLLGYTAWQDVFPHGLMGPFPSYHHLMDGQLFYLHELFLRADILSAEVCVERLEQDARFWRMVLNSSESLISSMVATASLRRNLHWTNLILDRLAQRGLTSGVPATWQRPFGDEERVMAHAWAGEMELITEYLHNLSAQELTGQIMLEDESTALSRIGDTIFMPLFLRQESLNRTAKLRADLLARFNVSYAKIPDVVTALAVSPLQYDEHDMRFPGLLYNPVGKLWDTLEPPDETGYMLRVPNLEGGRCALLAANRLRADSVSVTEVDEALARSPHRNPYTQQPFHWSEEVQGIVFNGLGEGGQRRYLFPIRALR